MSQPIEMNIDCSPFLPDLATFVGCDVSVLNQFYREFPKIERWGGGTVEPAVGQLLYILTRFFAPTISLEIGTNLGYSTACIAKALEDNKLGQLHTWEINKEYTEIAIVHLIDLKLDNKVLFHVGDSREDIVKTFNGRRIFLDLAFIDSEHTYETTKIELDIVSRALRRSGIILFHDIFSEGVAQAIKEFDGESFEYLEIPTQPNTGFGILMHVPPSDS